MSASSLPALLHLLRTHSVVEERISGQLSAVHGLSLSEALALMHLERAPLTRLSRIELARRLHTSASTATRLVQPLEKRGLVTREADSRDARLAYVVLTESARKLVENARKTLQLLSEELFKDRWTEAEISQFGAFLARLTAAQPGDIT